MRLTELLNKIKAIPDISKDIFIILVIVFVSVGGFALGRLSVLEEKRHDELRVIDQKTADTAFLAPVGGTTVAAVGGTSSSNSATIKGVFVGSRSGKIYYYPWCAGVKRIHEENKVWFSSKEDAEAKGYSASVSCKAI